MYNILAAEKHIADSAGERLIKAPEEGRKIVCW